MAARYWVGGTGTWDTTAGAKWALTSGGAGGQTVPGAADDVFFTALSGAVTVTWTTASATVLSINCTGFTGTLATGGNSKTLAGTTTLWTSPSTCTITGAPTLTASSTSAGSRTVTCNHLSPSATNSINFNFNVGSHTVILSGSGFRNVSLGFGGSSNGSFGVYGNVSLSPAILSAVNLTPTFLAAGSLNTVGKTIGGMIVNAPGAVVTTSGAVTLGASPSIATLTAGTLSLGGTLTTNIFSSTNSNTRAIAFGANNIVLNSIAAGATVLSMATATNFTWTGTGGFTRNQAATATMVFGTTGGTVSNAPNLTVNTGASALTITSGSYFKNLIFAGSTCTASGSVNMAGNLTLASGGTYTSVVPTFRASGTVTSTGKTLGALTVIGAGITVTLADSMTLGISIFFLAQGTINLAGFTLTASSLQSSNSNVRSINFGTGGSIVLSNSGTDLVNMGTATNFTRSGTGGITASGSGSALSYQFGPTGATSANVMDLTVTKTNAAEITFSSGSLVGSVNCPIGNAALVTQSGSTTVYGNLTLSATGTYTLFAPSFAASATVTSNGRTLYHVTVNGSGITVTLADAMTLNTGRELTLTQGTFTSAAFNVTAGSFISSNSNTRTLNMGSGTWTISGFLGWDIQNSTNMTLTAGTSTINMSHTGSKTFNGGGLTYYNLNQATSGSSYLTITGSNSFNNITNTLPSTGVIFQAGTTQTVANFGLSGAPGSFNTCLIQSTIAGSQFTLSKSSGAVESKFLRIQDSNVTGGASWYAYNSTNLGNNTGWKFNSPDMLAMFI